MKKGSKSRKCHYCGEIVMWWIPAGKTGLLGEPIWETKMLPNLATHNGRYCCKECKAKLMERR